MCTSIIFSPKNHYFGRNFDYEISYGQEVVITPRDYKFKFRKTNGIDKHFAIYGIAAVFDNYPLYFDAANERGLGMAGLNYAGQAYYSDEFDDDKTNISPFEFIPWVLSQCSTIEEAKDLISKTHLVNIDFSEKLKLSPLHWLLADKSGKSITVEPDKDGIHVYDNPVGVLTNNPPFPKQIFNLNNYSDVSPRMPENNFSDKIEFDPYSRGLGSRNLPGGVDSESRFVRATFTKYNAPVTDDETENIDNYFHILHAVEQPKGLDEIKPGLFEYTIYSDCFDFDNNEFYYTTYSNKQINHVKVDKENLDQETLVTFPILDKVTFNDQN
ncbi:choloylglycine hydrolase [Lactobacillus agrestimuris]|uniref:choloylglycine hydrolase n=1 Tax=Lactobacillus agrestimuris TaxID=2941328 RepID=UPI0020439F2A|nr:choloylglycine hydrolase [Lactobacillus agrestimuris]